MTDELPRLDKWLWTVRLYKTRALAASSCRGGHVEVDGQKAKASRTVRLGEVIAARVGEITRTVKVIGIPKSRVGPKLIQEYIDDLTPESEYAKLREKPPVKRPIAGFGRPTKKARRALDRFWGEPQR